MVLRVSNFVGHKTLDTMQAGRTEVVTFDLPQRCMLSDLTQDELRLLRNQCEEILYNKSRENIIYLSNITRIEEVSNYKRKEVTDE